MSGRPRRRPLYLFNHEYSKVALQYAPDMLGLRLFLTRSRQSREQRELPR